MTLLQIKFKNLNSIVLLVIVFILAMTSCGDNEEFMDCERELRTTIPMITSQDLSPCSDIVSMPFNNEVSYAVGTGIGRFLKYDVVPSRLEGFTKILHFSEFENCSEANGTFDGNANAEHTIGTKIITPNFPDSLNLSSIYNEAFLTSYTENGQESVTKLVGRIDNIVLFLSVRNLECSNDRIAAVELFNRIGAKVVM